MRVSVDSLSLGESKLSVRDRQFEGRETVDAMMFSNPHPFPLGCRFTISRKKVVVHWVVVDVIRAKI